MDDFRIVRPATPEETKAAAERNKEKFEPMGDTLTACVGAVREEVTEDENMGEPLFILVGGMMQMPGDEEGIAHMLLCSDAPDPAVIREWCQATLQMLDQTNQGNVIAGSTVPHTGGSQN